MAKFCKKNSRKLLQLAQNMLEDALKGDRFCRKEIGKYCFPTPGTFVSVSTEETKEISVNFTKALTFEEQKLYLQLWQKAQSGIHEVKAEEAVVIEAESQGIAEEKEP